MSTRVAVVGAHGRMGATMVAAVAAADDLELVAALGTGDDRAVLHGDLVDVAVHFQPALALMDDLRRCTEQGVHSVVGTTGLGDPELHLVRDWCDAAPEVGVLVAPNFGIGAVLLMRFAAQAAPYFESVEVVEYHHPDKADAPSGTARRTAELVAAARTSPSPDATRTGLAGARGADVEGVRVHAVRLRGMLAHEEVLLGSPGEVLTLRHDSTDRESFMPGALLGVRRVAAHPGLTVGLEHYLDPSAAAPSGPFARGPGRRSPSPRRSSPPRAARSAAPAAA